LGVGELQLFKFKGVRNLAKFQICYFSYRPHILIKDSWINPKLIGIWIFSLGLIFGGDWPPPNFQNFDILVFRCRELKFLHDSLPVIWKERFLPLRGGHSTPPSPECKNLICFVKYYYVLMWLSQVHWLTVKHLACIIWSIISAVMRH